MKGYDLKKAKFLILLMFLITILLTYLLTNYNYMSTLSTNANDYLRADKTQQYVIEVLNEQGKIDLKEMINNSNVTHLESDDGFRYSFFNTGSAHKPSIEAVSTISNEIMDQVVIGEKEYQEKNLVYEVRGKYDIKKAQVVGKIISHPYDRKENSYYLLLNLDNPPLMLNGLYKIDAADEVHQTIESNENIHCEKSQYMPFQLSESSFNQIKDFLIIGVTFILLIAFLIVTQTWAISYEKEIGIRFACGGVKKKVLIKLLLRLFVFLILSIVTGLGLSFLLINILGRALFINWFDVLILLIGLLLFNLIVALFYYIKLSRKSIITIISEGSL